MSNEALRSEMKSAFAAVGLKKVDKDTMSKCVALASACRISPQQMATCWEAFSCNKGNIKTLNDQLFSAYRAAVIKDTDSIAMVEDDDSKMGAVVTRPELGGRENLPNVTPPAKRASQASGRSAVDLLNSSSSSSRRVSLSPGPPVNLAAGEGSNLPKYSERQDVGKVVATFNPNNLEAAASRAKDSMSPRCNVDYSFETNVHKPYRHMFTTLDERAKALDRHLVQLGECMIHRYNLGGNEEESGNQDVAPLESVGVPRQDQICCIGRICNAAHEGRINATSVLLEGSRHSSGGARVELDLEHLKSTKSSYSLFPGQIVAVEGMNTSGRKLVAHRICEGAAPEPPVSTVKELMRYHHDDNFQGGQPLSIMAVAGPFTTSDNLSYEPLLDLMNTIKTHNPDVVIMTGPFVDVSHKAVQSGQTTVQDENGEDILVPYDTFFANKIAVLLEDLYAEESISTQFVLVPSLEDATAEWVYPQPPMSDRIPGGEDSDLPGGEGISIGTLGLHYVESAGREQETFRRVHCVSNPCTLKINELMIGVTSADVLFHMSADETNANLEPGSRLARISQHMIQQRSYYPLFPAASGANLNLKFMSQWSMFCQPDLLIIPSKLMSFARPVLESTVVVNPGRLSRDTTGGTYAMIDVHPIKRETLENAGGDNVELQHSIQERTRVEIKRI